MQLVAESQAVRETSHDHLRPRVSGLDTGHLFTSALLGERIHSVRRMRRIVDYYFVGRKRYNLLHRTVVQ